MEQDIPKGKKDGPPTRVVANVLNGKKSRWAFKRLRAAVPIKRHDPLANFQAQRSMIEGMRRRISSGWSQPWPAVTWRGHRVALSRHEFSLHYIFSLAPFSLQMEME